MRISILYKIIGIKCDEVGVQSYILSLAYIVTRKFYTIFNTLKRFSTNFYTKIRTLFKR